MSHHTHGSHAGHAEPNYFAVISVLTVLTVLEIGVVFLPIPRLAIGILLVGLALTKAIMVAMFFMHLKFEKWALALIAGTPLILCTLLMFALLPDSNPELNSAKSTAAPVQHHP
ncbi:MAG TPA: cytochrome C oxidase subunit IV family protein [Candidatus Polarisedimenticolia bacterium]|nr:cytochrome C oxidase subunit IV family protein [Candidatus Polarisedimenticolia bacterium]